MYIHASHLNLANESTLHADLMHTLTNLSYLPASTSDTSTIMLVMMATSRRALILACKLVSILLTACLNGYLILIFGVFVKKKSFSNLIFLSIAVSDFIIGTLSMTTQLLIDIVEEWPFDKISCLVSIYMQYAIPDTTIFALLILTAHRYIQLKSPVQVNETLTKLNLLKLLSPWLIATTFWVTSLACLVNNGEWSLKRCDILPSFAFKTGMIKISIFFQTN